MRVLGIVPARGGSKGVNRKNIQLLAGRTLLQWTVETALSARRIDRLILSTEDNEIAEIGSKLGVEVPFLRPPELARDDTPMIPVIQHAITAIEKENDKYEAILLLQPTCPFRKKEDIDGAVRLLEESGADSVISFVSVGEKHPARMKYINDRGMAIDPPFSEEVEGQRRQELPQLFIREGSIYLTLREVIMEQNSLKGQTCRAWIIPPERTCNIDTLFDLFVAEQMVKYGIIK